MQEPETSLQERARRVIAANSENFIELIKTAQLDPSRDLRFSNWSGIDFKRLDLRNFDFTGSRLVDCDFDGAQIKGARFEGADIKGVNLRKAKDWSSYLKGWTLPKQAVGTRHLRTGAVFQDAPFGPQMVVVPQGEFMMGSPEGEGEEDEHPQQKVTFANRFAVGMYPVTRDEYATFIDAVERDGRGDAARNKGWQIDPDAEWRKPGFEQDDDHPVVNVSWHDAQACVDWLREKSGGKHYRLLSEAEWEYCCRAKTKAGTEAAYSTGDTITQRQANFDGTTRGTTPVSKFPPNHFGLHDMHGNVWEWCQDTYVDTLKGIPKDGAPRDLDGDGDGDGGGRVVRGGSWVDLPRNLRAAFRDRGTADYRSGSLGFRVGRTLTP